MKVFKGTIRTRNRAIGAITDGDEHLEAAWVDATTIADALRRMTRLGRQRCGSSGRIFVRVTAIAEKGRLGE